MNNIKIKKIYILQYSLKKDILSKLYLSALYIALYVIFLFPEFLHGSTINIQIDNYPECIMQGNFKNIAYNREVNINNSAVIIESIHSKLFQYNQKTKLIINDIAESYEIINNNKSIRIKIRDDAKWSNGDDILADHYILNVQFALKYKKRDTYPSDILFNIKNAKEIYDNELSIEQIGIQKINEKEFIIHLTSQIPFIDKLLSNDELIILHPNNLLQLYENSISCDDVLEFYTTGPYKISSWDQDKGIINLSKNEHHHDAKSISIDSIKIYVAKDYYKDKIKIIYDDKIQTPENIENKYKENIITKTRSNYRAGLIDIIFFDKINNLQLLDLLYHRSLSHDPTMHYTSLSINPSINKDIRRAIALILDFNVINKINNNIKQISKGISLHELGGPELKYNKLNINDLSAKERAKEARAIMSNLGYSNDNILKLNMLKRDDSHDINGVYKFIKNSLKGIYIDLTIYDQEYWHDRYGNQFNNTYYDISINTYKAHSNDQYNHLTYHTNKFLNNISFNSDLLGKIEFVKANQGSYSSNDHYRTALLNNLEQSILDEYIILPMYSDKRFFVLSDKIHINENYSSISIKNMTFKK